MTPKLNGHPKSKAARGRLGAHVDEAGVSYCAWAPDFFSLEVLVTRGESPVEIALVRDDDGYWHGRDHEGRAGDLYQFRENQGKLLPDVASRFQPRGVHGPSQCVDPLAYRWQCETWRRPRWSGQSIYEFHVGTFTAEGTFVSAIARLDHVVELGVEAIQLMPVADFAGERNWGYDGVALYAPARCYGRPDDLRALVDAAHARGLAVILDVVYNHLGPAGNYLGAYSGDYFSSDHRTPWGPALNLDGPRREPVRDFIVGNATYWLDEFRFDGLRLDATHAMTDSSERHVLEELAQAVHQRGGFVIAEDERNSAILLQDSAGEGFHFDATWSDDFHHQARVAMTSESESYFASYAGTSVALADTLRHGWTYRGQPFPFWNGRPRGTESAHLATSSFVVCIENHDQVGNRAHGERLEHLVSPAQFRAASLLLCLSPYPPMLFMGQEWAASSPFLFFTDHEGEVGRLISAARQREFDQAGLNRTTRGDFPDPQDPATFLKSKLNWAERNEPEHGNTLALYREALKFRRKIVEGGGTHRENWRAEAVGEFLALRYQFGSTCWLLLSTVRPASLAAAPPNDILALPGGEGWHLLLCSDGARFGGDPAIAATIGSLTGPVTALFAAGTEASDAAV